MIKIILQIFSVMNCRTIYGQGIIPSLCFKWFPLFVTVPFLDQVKLCAGKKMQKNSGKTAQWANVNINFSPTCFAGFML